MAAPLDDDETELTSSKLGTKEHWDAVYARELDTFNDTKDVGEVWFGMDSVERIADWMDECPLINAKDSVLDLGCGNGTLLIELGKRGYTNLTGVDYSGAAIDLAKSIAKSEELDIRYETGDILRELPSKESCLSASYDVCLDKGTYDAISLNPENPKMQRTRYTENIQQLISPNGLFVLTSCNWTQEELVEHFSEGFSLLKKIPSPTFQFGGRSGSRETVLVFQKRPSS